MSARYIPSLFAAAVAIATGAVSQAQLRTLENASLAQHYGTDDDSTDAVPIGFGITFGADTYSVLFVNNNGNATFAFPSGLGNPSEIVGGLAQQGGPVLAPFFADVDTTYTGTLTYGTGEMAGFDAFVATWDLVPAFGSTSVATEFNTFQLFLVDRSDTGAGNFDFEFNYTRIDWDAGANSAGPSALAGYWNGMSPEFLLPGAGLSDSFLDSSNGGAALIHHSLGVPFDGASMLGRYAFNVRDGLVQLGTSVDPNPPGGPSPVPEASTYGFVAGTGLFALALLRRRPGRSANSDLTTAR